MTTPPTSRRLIALVACATALAIGGCGSDDEQEPKGAPIPAAQSQALQVRLEEIQRRFDFGDGACTDIQDDSKPAVEQILSSIPKDVAADVRSALNDSFDHLFSLSADQCDEKKGQDTNTTPTTPTETETVETTTTETETIPTTPTETEQTTPTTPEPPVTTPTPPENENGKGNGNGNGNGVGQGGGGGAAGPGDEQ